MGEHFTGEVKAAMSFDFALNSVQREDVERELSMLSDDELTLERMAELKHELLERWGKLNHS